MTVGKAIYYLLTNATDVTDVVSTRVYPEIAQQDADLPYIVYAIANNEPTDTKPEPSKLDTAQVEVNIYSQSYTEAIDLAVAVRAALDRVKGTYSGVNVQSIQYLNEIIDFDEPQRAYNISADYDVRISRTDFEIAQGSPISGTNLGELNDVDVTGVTNGQLIAYNSTTGNWEAADDASGGAVDSVNGQTGVVVLDMDDIDDVDAATPFGGDVLQWTGTAWEPSGKLNLLYSLLKEGTDTSIKNGGGTDSELKLESTKATVSTGITKVVLTETSPGDIEFVVATDADGDTAFTALHLDGSSTANRADLLVKFGTYFKFEDGNFTQSIRPSSGATQNTTITLPNRSGVLGREEDIPTSVTNLNDVTSAGSGAIITDAERTNLTTNTAKVGLIAGGTTGQALVKSTGTDYDVEWADIAVDVQYHDRYATESETLRSGGAETIELYYSAQADGDGLAESASSDTPAAGYDIRRKLYYSEAGFADPDTGTWTQFTAIADNTTFANAKAALLAYLKERTGGTVPISLKMTWEEVAEATLLLDTYTGAAAAYSLRKLRTAYTGDAVEVYNGSSYADIGFDGSGELDTTALAAHCGSNDGFVSKWYSQTGSNDATQTTTANMPKIYDGATTSVVTRGGKPSVYRVDSTDLLNITGFDNISYIYVGEFLVGGRVFGTGQASVSTDGLNGYRNFGFEWANGNLTALHNGTDISSTNTLIPISGGLSFDIFLGKTSRTDPADATTVGAGNPSYISELISWSTDESSNFTAMSTAVNNYYNVY